MNKERLLELADAIREEPDLYNQGHWGAPWCGTPGCILGWAVTLFSDTGGLESPTYPGEMVFDRQKAGPLLGLPTHSPLFCDFWPIHWLPDHDNRLDYDLTETIFAPTARDAQRVLHKIVKGDITL